MQFPVLPIDQNDKFKLYRAEDDPNMVKLEFLNPTTQETTHALINLEAGDKANPQGNTWLHVASQVGLEHLVRGLIEKGGKKLDVDVRNCFDETPMMLASRVGRHLAVAILADHHADINAIRRQTGWSVLHEAAFSGDKETVTFLLQGGARITEAKWAFNQDLFASLEIIATPFIVACVKGDPEFVRIFINAGENPHQVLKNGLNALFFCVKSNPRTCELLLKEYRVNPNPTAQGFEPLIHYVTDVHLMQSFLECGAKIDILNSSNETPLYMQCGPLGNPDLILLLLQNGASVNHETYDRKCNHPLVRFLRTLCTPDPSNPQLFNHRSIDPIKVIAVIKAFEEKGIMLSESEVDLLILFQKCLPVESPDLTAYLETKKRRMKVPSLSQEGSVSRGTKRQDVQGKPTSKDFIDGAFSVYSKKEEDLVDDREETTSVAFIEKAGLVSIYGLDNDDEVLLVFEDPENHEKLALHINLAHDADTIIASNGSTCLHLGAMLGLAFLVTEFVRRRGTGFEIDVRNIDDQTPLMLAAMHGKPNMVKILADGGADVNAVNHETGWSVLHEAAYAGVTETVILLLQRGARIIEISRSLVLPDGVCCRQWTPLFAAVPKGNVSIIKALINAGDDPHRVLSFNQNILHFAARYMQLTVCRLLLAEFHVNPNLIDKSGGSPFNSQSKGYNIELIKLFLEFGANIDLRRSQYEHSILAKCCYLDFETDPEMIVYLLDHGADPNQEIYQIFMHRPLEFCLDRTKARERQWITEEQMLQIASAFIKKGARIDDITLSHFRTSRFNKSTALERLIKMNGKFILQDKNNKDEKKCVIL